MKSKFYILKGREIVGTNDIREWGKAFESADRHIGLEEFGNIKISTVFLGLDHNFVPSGPPILFETMVFGGKFDGETERYFTYEEAEKGHALMVKKVKETL